MAQITLARLAVALVTIASVIPAPFVTLWPDTIRDLSASLTVARAEAFVLVGPAFNFGPHLGPVWIWLQAIPLVFEPSLQAVAIWVGLIASLKFVLLFEIGRTLDSARLGLCIVAAAAFPSVAVYQWTVFMHPSWVETAITLTLLLVICAVKRRSILLAILGAAALGFAVQMHPTALFYAPAVAWAIHVCSGGGRRSALHLILGAGLVALWFAPIVLAPDVPFDGTRRAAMVGARCADHRGGQAECALDSARRIGRAVTAFDPGDLAIVLRTAYFEIPRASGDSAIAAGFPRVLWEAALAMVGLVALGGVVYRIARGPNRLVVAMLVIALGIGWTVATAIREYTAFWAAYFLVPLSALAFGAGIDRFAGSRVMLVRAAGTVVVTLAFAVFIVAAWGARSAGAGGVIESRLPVLGDLRDPASDSVRANLLTAAARDALAREICSVPRVTLHGELAFGLGGSTGLDLRLHCPLRPGGVTLLGPTSAGEAWTALPAADAWTLRKVPRAGLKGMVALPVHRALHPAAGMPIDPRWDYFERLLDRGEMRPVRLEFRTEPGEAVMVYRLKPFAAAWRNFRVLRNGVAAAPVLATHNSEVFVSAPDAGTTWRVEFDTDAPQWVDVHTF